MDLDQKYELGEVVANDAESKTFRAREIATGRQLLVHLLFGGKGPAGQEPLLGILLQRMVDASAERRRQILEISDYKGMPFAVTEVLPGFRTLRAWLDQDRLVQPSPSAPTDPMTRAGMWKIPPIEKAGQSAAAKPPEPEPVKPAQEPDEFSRLFGAAPSERTPSAPVETGRHAGEFTRLFRATVGDPRSARPAEPAPAAEAEPPGAAPGEFTKLFHSPMSSPSIPPAGPVNSAPEPGWPAPERENAPGEFTRLFQSPPAAAGPELPAQPVPSGAGPGEFTRLFQSRTQSPPALPSQPEARPSAPSAPKGGPGEFTRVFGSPTVGKTSQPAPPPSRASAATGVFATPGRTPEPVRSMDEPHAPGEYTRLFGAAAAVPPPPPAPAVRPAAPQAHAGAPTIPARSSNLPLLLIGAFVLLLTAIVVLYFVLR